MWSSFLGFLLVFHTCATKNLGRPRNEYNKILLGLHLLATLINHSPQFFSTSHRMNRKINILILHGDSQLVDQLTAISAGSLHIGYTMRWRSLGDIHYREPQVQGFVYCRDQNQVVHITNLYVATRILSSRVQKVNSSSWANTICVIERWQKWNSWELHTAAISNKRAQLCQVEWSRRTSANDRELRESFNPSIE